MPRAPRDESRRTAGQPPRKPARVPHPGRLPASARPAPPEPRKPTVKVLVEAEGVAAAKPAQPDKDGSGQPFLTLAQFLKAIEAAPTGGQAKQLARAGGILVNGEAEARPGRKLHDGDVVRFADEEYVVQVER